MAWYGEARPGKAWITARPGEARLGKARQGQAWIMVKPKKERKKMKKNKMYFGGVPTDMDIKKLREAFPPADMEPGDLIDYEIVEKIIDAKLRSHRWAAVTTRWRRLVEHETGKIIGTDPGVGFKVLSEPEKVDLAGSKLRSASKFARRSVVVASRVITSQLTAEERQRLDHQTKISGAIIATANLKSKLELPQL